MLENTRTATYWIDRYSLLPHPEGGYFKETYRSSEEIPEDGLPARFPAARTFSTAIFFLLQSTDFSAFHRIKADELWHFYAGGALEIFVIDPESGALHVIRLGNNSDQGEHFQAVVPAGAWFASRPAVGTEYALVGCTVAPGFDFQDFEMAERQALTATYPDHATLIAELTR